MRKVDVTVDVTDAVHLGQTLNTVATVCLPDTVPADPVVCFAFPGGGYSRRYFTFDVTGGDEGSQADWHTQRGWIFVACDHLYCGDSDQPADPSALTFEHLAGANHATVGHILGLLADGGLVGGLAPVRTPTVIGIGQSMGGATLVLQQGQRSTFTGIGVLGWSAMHSVNWTPPGSPKGPARYFPRGTNVGALTPEVFTEAMPEMTLDEKGMPAAVAAFHFDGEPRDIVEADMIDYPRRRGNPPVWASTTIPPCSMTMMSPGAVAAEAASIDVPVLIAVGERDCCPDPMFEPKGYPRSSDVTVYICPQMAHMHNFAVTRTRLWARIQAWGDGIWAQRRPVCQSTK